MLICNDGGINHLAVSQNTPSIGVICPTSDPVRWTAWHKDIHFYFKGWHSDDKKDNSFNISPEQVFEKLEDFFKK